jgi:hypothetical protein
VCHVFRKIKGEKDHKNFINHYGRKIVTKIRQKRIPQNDRKYEKFKMITKLFSNVIYIIVAKTITTR